MLRFQRLRAAPRVLTTLVIAGALVLIVASPARAGFVDPPPPPPGGVDLGSSDHSGSTGGGGVSGGAGPVVSAASQPACVWDNSTSMLTPDQMDESTADLLAAKGKVDLAKDLHDTCDDDPLGWWEDYASCRQGFVNVAKDQAVPPTGDDASVGAWYTCTPFCPVKEIYQLPPWCAASDFWSDTMPPGLNKYTPAQAAAVLIASIHLNPVSIGMAPLLKVHSDDPAGTAAYRRTWVGVPVWLWVENPSQGAQFGTLHFEKTIGGLDVAATATADNVQWASGDGTTVHCSSFTPFDEAAMAGKPAMASPTCGFEYTHTSASQPGGVFTVTATTVWSVHWTAGDDEGTVNKGAATSSTTVQVGQLESVNVPLTQQDIDWAMSH